jgi:lipid A 3-O-deacylase
MKYRLWLYAFFFLIAVPLLSQESDTIRPSATGKGFFSYRYENDVFTGTDYYYTQGVQAMLVLPGLKHSPVNYLLPGLANSHEYNGLSIQQDCYTPTKLAPDTVLKGDRPYAGDIFVQEFKISNDAQHLQRLTSGIDLGLLGRCSLCEEEQKTIHRALVDQQPNGWGFQVNQDALINYELGYDKGLYVSQFVEFIVQAQVMAGSFKDNVSAGALLRIGSLHPYFSNYGPAHKKKEDVQEFYAFAQGNASLIGYDALMQGGPFDRNNSYIIPVSGIERMVYQFRGGVAFSAGKFRMEYSQTYLSPEFAGGHYHAWGTVLLQFGF